MSVDIDQVTNASTVRNLLVERAFRDAFAIGQSVAAESSAWDHAFTLKEVASEIRLMIETIEPTDVTQRYAHGLRLHALSLLFVTKLLEADARGEFDEKGDCVHNAEAAYDRQEGGRYWCRECQSLVTRTEDGWIKQ